MSPERNYKVQKSGSEILVTRIWALFCFALVWYSHVLQIKQNLFSSPFLYFMFLCIGYNCYLLFLCEMKGNSNTTTCRWWNFKGLKHQWQNTALDHSSLKWADFCFLLFRKKKKRKKKFTIEFSVTFVIWVKLSSVGDPVAFIFALQMKVSLHPSTLFSMIRKTILMLSPPHDSVCNLFKSCPWLQCREVSQDHCLYDLIILLLTNEFSATDKWVRQRLGCSVRVVLFLQFWQERKNLKTYFFCQLWKSWIFW